MTRYIVTYQYCGSRYFDSPLHTRVERMSFTTRREAQAWADSEHPHLPDFKVRGIHSEDEIVVRGTYCSASERAHRSDRCTDVAIVLGSYRFR